MRFPTRIVRLGALPLFLVLPILLAAGSISPGFEAAPDAAPPLSKPQAKPGGMSLAQWHEEKQAAEAAINAPRGTERIARCEAFIREHPDYPQLNQMLLVLVDATIETRSFDPAKLASLLERLAETKSLQSPRTPEFLVGRYYFRYRLPLESAQRLLNKARKELAEERAALAKETDPMRRKERRERLDFREPKVDLEQGRVLLAKGQYHDALRLLLRAEQGYARSGRAGIAIQDSPGTATRMVSYPWLDWLNLSLATAYARTGDHERAVLRLEQVRNFFEISSEPEVAPAAEALRKELSLPPLEQSEVRAEARPAPDFKLKDLNGKEVALADFKDRVVLAMFWATW